MTPEKNGFLLRIIVMVSYRALYTLLRQSGLDIRIRMFLGLPSLRQILPFSHKDVERTNIMLVMRPVVEIHFNTILTKNLMFKTEDNVESNIFFASLKSLKKGVGLGVGSGSRPISQRHGSAPKCCGSPTMLLSLIRLFLFKTYLEGVSYEEPAAVDAGAQVIRVHGNVTHLLDRLPTSGLQVYRF